MLIVNVVSKSDLGIYTIIQQPTAILGAVLLCNMYISLNSLKIKNPSIQLLNTWIGSSIKTQTYAFSSRVRMYYSSHFNG